MKWKTLESKEIFKTGFVKIDQQKCEMPDGRIMPSYFVLRLPDWVNIVPITKDNQVILIKQYRHATQEIHWEVPGGAVHRGEDAQKGALRELEEETGYTSTNLIQVGLNFPNPALQDNRIYTYLALDCEFKGPQELDPFEEIEVELRPLEQVRTDLANGMFNHNIVVSSLYQALTRL